MKGNSGDVLVCKSCKKLFQNRGMGFGYCAVCMAEDEELLLQVKNYVKEHETATALEVCNETGISEKRLLGYLEDRRLLLPKDSRIYGKCQMCGAQIREGKYCMNCVSDLKENIRELWGEGVFAPVSKRIQRNT